MNGRNGHIVRWLLWIKPRTRDTYVETPFGFWNDVYDRDFTVDAEVRAYTGAYGTFIPPKIIYEKGLKVQEIQIGFSNLNPTIDNALRVYETSGAPVFLHKALFDTDMNLLEIEEKFRGQISRFPNAIPETNGKMSATLHCVSSARLGTLTLGALKSNIAQKERLATDRFREYASVSPASADFWGKDS